MAASEQLLAIAHNAIAKARMEGMDECDAYHVGCGAVIRHGRDIGAFEWLSKEMAAAIEAVVKSAMTHQAEL